MTHARSHMPNCISGSGSGGMGINSCHLFIEHLLCATGRYYRSHVTDEETAFQEG